MTQQDSAELKEIRKAADEMAHRLWGLSVSTVLVPELDRILAVAKRLDAERDAAVARAGRLRDVIRFWAEEDPPPQYWRDTEGKIDGLAWFAAQLEPGDLDAPSEGT